LGVIVSPNESFVVESGHLVFKKILLFGGEVGKSVEIVIRVIVLGHAPTEGEVVKAGLIVVTDILIEETSYVLFRGRMMK
jgi:hypothetical protein